MEPKTKKILAAVIICAVLLAVPAALMLSTGEFFPKEEEPYTILLALPDSETHDSFTALSTVGCYTASKSKDSAINLSLCIVDSGAAAEEQFLATLNKTAPQLVFAPGYTTAEFIKETAARYPGIAFLTMDNSFSSYPENLADIQFRNEEVGFVTGYVAGMMTESKKIGFLGGQDDANIGRFLYGFLAGIDIAEKERGVAITTLTDYTNDYSNETLGYELSEKMYNEGADIIFTVCGNSGLGGIAAASDLNKYVIGVDSDMNVYAPNNVLFSAVKNIETVVSNVITEYSKGASFQGEVSTGYQDGAFSLKSYLDVVPDSVIKTAEKLEQAIKNGEVSIPKTAEEYATWDVFSAVAAL